MYEEATGFHPGPRQPVPAPPNRVSPVQDAIDVQEEKGRRSGVRPGGAEESGALGLGARRGGRHGAGAGAGCPSRGAAQAWAATSRVQG